jgi:hypothetical protein
MADLQRARKDEAETRPRPEAADLAADPARPTDVIRSLQQQAGNGAVAALLGAASPQPTGAQAHKTKPGAAGTAAAAQPASGFEAELFERSILGPLRAAHANVRDAPPDAAVALEHLYPVGQALLDYEQRYRGRDEGLSQAFYAARGWLAGAVVELQRRAGAKPVMTDEQIADRVQGAIEDLLALEGRLH